MLSKSLLAHLLRKQKPFLNIRLYANELNLEKLEAESGVDLEIDEEATLKEELLQKKRNKSGLNVAHRNMLMEEVPYPEAKHWIHGTLRYNRKLYGKYGKKSGLDPAFCWPTKEELDAKKDYENVAYPYSVPQLVEMAMMKKKEQNAVVEARQANIASKMEKLETWKKELRDKIVMKESQALAAKIRKEKLIEEVRRHFGYTVDPRDEKFKAMLEKKEKEQKKLDKEIRRKAKEDKMVSKLLATKKERDDTKET